MKQKTIELDLFSPSDFEGENVKKNLQEEKESSSLVSPSYAWGRDAVSGGKVSLYASAASVASLFLRLSQSKFRSSFYLNKKDRDIISKKGMTTIREHAHKIIAKRLAPAFIPNDGKQTPMRHGTSPVFIAQHATGCCCRGCLEKWHHIPKGRALTEDEQEYVVEIIMQWIGRKME